MKILLANSGGLDSAIMARKLNEDGHEVHSLYVNSHSLGYEESMIAAQETANRFCASHKVIDIDWGYTPNHYEDADTFVMYDDAVGMENLPRLWSGPPNMGMVIMSITVSYAKTLGINECCGGFAGTRSAEMYDIYNSAQLANLNPRWRPIYHAPYGAMGTDEALAFTGYSREDFPWVSKSVPEEV